MEVGLLPRNRLKCIQTNLLLFKMLGEVVIWQIEVFGNALN